MAFSSIVFLLLFLPISVFGYYVVDFKYKNFFLLIISILFYVWGGSLTFPILLISIILNYIFALLIQKFQTNKYLSKTIIIIMLVVNIGVLFVFKYLDFTIININYLFHLNIISPHWSLPLGISFFTFSAISYVLDVYFGVTNAEKNFFNVALYILFFPKIISGPIVKWEDFNRQISNREISSEKIAKGLERFIIGFAKKVIVSDSIASFVDLTFNSSYLKDNSILISWMAVFGYLIQLYYDFSGYSDMAIGIAKLFGFDLAENFNYPYISKRVSEFWARWHISLGTWIKHYIYTPVFRSLSKKKIKKTGKRYSIKKCDYIALFISWVVTGIWHGAGYKFIIWGMFQFIFILFERIFDDFSKKHKNAKKIQNLFLVHIFPHLYFLFVISIGQMIFRSNNLIQACKYFLSLFGLNNNPIYNDIDLFYLKQYLIIIIIGCIFSIPIIPFVKNNINIKNGKLLFIGKKIIIICLLFISLGFTVGNTYKAFIYFNF